MKPQTPEMTARRIASAPAHYRSLVAAVDREPRFAVIRGGQSVEQVKRYLPDGYDLMESFTDERDKLVVIIGGVDIAGWTLDGYVIPRLASGLMFAEEIPA